MSCLSIYAGPTAYRKIQQEGLSADQFKVMIGASGGPKWFVLYGLDRYLFGDFFAGRSEPLHTLGSSAGAWRLCCLATSNPVAAIERLAIRYSEEAYSDKPTVAEITEKANSMLEYVLGEGGIREIVDNQVFRTHIVAARAKGWGGSRNKSMQGIALLAGALSNAVSRKALTTFFERTLFSNMGQSSPWRSLTDLPTAHHDISEENLKNVMMATGSIPFALEGVRDIDGAAKGLYWDGGITDYHFDLPFHRGDGLVLYPHFSSRVVPGWFDKKIKWRGINPQHFHNVVLITPSKEFVDSLDEGKIPDRSDFQKYDSESRLKYWRNVLNRSNDLANEFSAMVKTGAGLDNIHRFEDRPSA